MINNIVVKGKTVGVLKVGNTYYISLTDLARQVNFDEPKIPILSWMRNKDIISFLGLWEKLNNINFKGHEFETFKNEAGSNKT